MLQPHRMRMFASTMQEMQTVWTWNCRLSAPCPVNQRKGIAELNAYSDQEVQSRVNQLVANAEKFCKDRSDRLGQDMRNSATPVSSTNTYVGHDPVYMGKDTSKALK